MIGNQLDLAVKDSIFDPNLSRSDPAAKVHVRKQGKDTFYYKVFVYLEGNDLPYVDYVIYTLDETFPEPIRTVTRTPANPNCQLVIWTWGLFIVKTRIFDKRGFAYDVEHQLSYDKQLPTESDKYVYEEDDKANARPTLVSSAS